MKTTREIHSWIKANHGKCATAALTDHDCYALVASVNMTPLISHEGAAQPLFDGYRAIVLEMQPKTRWMAYQTIAMELDWGHRAMIWAKAGLPEADKPAGKASFEPGGTYQDLSKV